MPDALDGLELITSAANPLVKLSRQLSTRRRARYREGLFLVEGVRAIQTAIEHKTRLETVILDDERRGEVPSALVLFYTQHARRVVAMEHSLFASIADAEHPQSVLAVAGIPERTFTWPATSIVALDAIRDPGNLGAIIRTASAAGAGGIVLLPGCVDPFNPKTVRASAGTVTSIPIAQSPSIEAVKADYFSNPQEVAVLAADAAGAVNYRDVDWKNPLILIAGNESHGLSDSARSSTTQFVRIPMEDGVESLNVSVATGILLFRMRAVRTRD